MRNEQPGDAALVNDTRTPPARGPLGMTLYQWTVLFAAWLGWGFDVFDGLLFNFVAPNCVPTLLHLQIGSKTAANATMLWTAICTSLLLIGWAVGGLLFGKLADRLGRTKTLLVTMLLYAVGTACCALAPNIWVLLLCRLVASLGIGGEWAAGAAMVAEVVPEKRRVEAGALLYTSAPAGLFLATFLNHSIAGELFKGHPEFSWRYVFLCGLIPAAVALFVRASLKEPERWVAAVATPEPKATIRDLFTPAMRPLVVSGFIPAVTILITWWSCNAFLQVLTANQAHADSIAHGLSKALMQAHIEEWKTLASNAFNWGGLIGTLLTIPAAKYLGRKVMFGIYFVLSAAAMLTAFGHDWPAVTRLYLWFPIGLTVFGVFGSFTYYLPELFPTRLRATGSGFCYNVGRIVTAVGPMLVYQISTQGTDIVKSSIHALFLLGFVPLIGLLFFPWVIETKNKMLEA